MARIDFIENADAAQIADWLAARLKQALAARAGTVAISVPGGSTPFPIFERLVMRDLDWPRIEIWPGDDRIVPEDHPSSNSGRIRTIFEPVGASVSTLVGAGEIPHFAIVWLGMGADGHIASLFPNTDPQVDEPQAVLRLTPDPLPPEAPFERMTLTIPALVDTDQMMFTLGGSAAKREIFEAAIRGENDLPVARLLSRADMPLTCFT